MPTPVDGSKTLAPIKSFEDTQWDLVCDSFVRAWRNGERPRLETYLPTTPPATRTALLLELLREEFSLRLQVGESFVIGDYHARFPDDRETIARAFLLFKDSSQGDSTLLNPQAVSETSTSRQEPNTFHHGLDRYRKLREIGSGTFGKVWLAEDVDLRRYVAIKEPRENDSRNRLNLETYLSEARVLASFDHPNIVPVYDVGMTSEGACYIVSKWIEGYDLKAYLLRKPLSFERTAEMIAQVAEALHQTHVRGLVHRDIKPANILIDGQGRCYVTDFGLALSKLEHDKSTGIVGTPAYMSPEQARGEGHLVDGRSDLFCLGVVMYEMLTGTRPFSSTERVEVLAQIMNASPRRPRDRNAAIPAELERICLKALSKLPNDRYQCGAEFADDLRCWASTPAASRNQQTEIKVIPKGLRSFDASDCTFFLDLLPGIRDRDGIPKSLQFWKDRIEETGSDRTFRVGLLYGPSGSGKSSLMKAGLLPRLSPGIVPIYLESTPEELETRLLNEVIKAIPKADGNSLKDALSSIRRHKLVAAGGKLVLILDQFEQWLFAESDYANASLTHALAQCDGTTIQAIILVRDDFWLSVSRFLRELDIPISERENSQLVDLFDLEHASKVLGLFGVAYGRLPPLSDTWNQDQREFIRSAVNSLAENRKVVSVQLALFADMMQSRPWTTATLRELGGIEGIGSTFLEEIFGSRHTSIQHRKHQKAARRLLASLLPPIGMDIRGSLRKSSDLQKAAGYEDRPREFQELIAILDQELKLITPVDDAKTSDEGRFSADEPMRQSLNYQLAHDYLVPSLRQWLTRKQRETKKGRAELKLGERAAAWTSKRENHQLPTLMEWIQIRRWTDRRRWTASEQAAMRTAWQVHLRNWGGSLGIIVLIGAIIAFLFHQQQLRSRQETIRVALDSLQNTLGPAVPVNTQKLVSMDQPDRIRTELMHRYDTAREPRMKLSLAFGLASFGRVESEYIVSQIDTIEDRDTSNLIAALRHHPSGSIDALRKAVSECQTPELHQRKARLALAALGVGDTTLPIDACEFEGRTDHGVRTWFIEELPRWELDLGNLVDTVQYSKSPALRSAICLGLGQIPASRIRTDQRKQLVDMTTKWFALPDSSTHSAASWLMRQWDLPEPIIADASRRVEGRNWFVNSQGAAFSRINPPSFGYKPFLDPVEPFYKESTRIDQLPEAEKQLAENRWRRGLCLYHMNQFRSALEEFDAALASQGDLSEEVREVLHQTRLLTLARLNRSEQAEMELAKWLSGNPNPNEIARIETLVLLWLNRKEGAVKRLQKGLANADSADRNALYSLALATACVAAYGKPPEEEQQPWIDQALTLLERWTRNEDDRYRLRNEPDLSALYQQPRFQALAAEPLATRRPYWIANREISVREFDVFMADEDYQGKKPSDWKESRSAYSLSVSEDRPVGWVNWFDAVMYCNWLSIQEGRQPAYRLGANRIMLLEKDQCIEVDNWLVVESADGYRLPREMEWEHACRAGTATEWSPGNDETLLAKYCQMIPSKGLEVCGKKLPNAWGLHDMHGNASEWCWDSDLSYTYRIFRAGCWFHLASISRSAYRDRTSPWVRRDDQGFRLVFSDRSDGGEGTLTGCFTKYHECPGNEPGKLSMSWYP